MGATDNSNNTHTADNCRIATWVEFDRRLRGGQRKLLSTLEKFDRPILVCGCQRSGTTAVANLIKRATTLTYPDKTGDSELDDALVLSGCTEWSESRRPCFQTTYLNEQFDEYWQHDNYTIVWVLREPVAVVRSMMTNWSGAALERLYRGVGQRHRHQVTEVTGLRRFLPGADALAKACASYIGKLEQLNVLSRTLPEERLVVIDYADLIALKSTLIKELCLRLNLDYSKSLESLIGPRTRHRRPRLMLQDIHRYAEQNCFALYRQCEEQARKLAPA